MASESAVLERRGRTPPGWARGLIAIWLMAGALTLLALGLVRTGTPINVDVDGRQSQVRTHASTVGAVLRQAGVDLAPEDLVSVGQGMPLAPQQAAASLLGAGDTIHIRRARTVALSVDGRLWQVRTQATTVGQLLGQAGVQVGAGDEIWLRDSAESGAEAEAACFSAAQGKRCGRRVSADSPLAGQIDLYPAGDRPLLAAPSQPQSSRPPLVALHRATPVLLRDGGNVLTVHTTADTVAEVLREQGITMFLGDRVIPGVQTRVRPSTTISIRRSMPVAIVADGHTLHTRTLAETVSGVLAQEGVALVGRDIVSPTLASPVQADVPIRVTRVRDELAVEFETIPYTTIWVADSEMELDTRRLVRNGEVGLTKRRYRIVYEDGREVSRSLEDSWTEQAPVTKTLSYGTKIVIRTLDTPNGPIEYWRKMRVYTTSYTAASSGKAPTNPRYGYTRLGAKATKGIVAVDPTVIALRSWLYIPGYGLAYAADTGGGVKGKFVDLCWDVGAYQSWHWWTDVYVLTPVPPRSQIRWLLPDWPKYPDRRR